jgi:hypothetical protein
VSATPTKTIITATAAATAAAVFVSRNMKEGASPYVDEHVLQDVLLTFGVLLIGGVLLNGIKEPDSIGRGLLWGAGGLAATYGIDKALNRGM